MYFPKTWVAPLDIHQELIVTPGSEEFKEVEENFRRTIGGQSPELLEVNQSLAPLADLFNRSTSHL